MPRIVVVPYDDRWPAEFASTRSVLASALGECAARIDHIGSTSVPGLDAKDVIDVQVSVRSLEAPGLDDAFASIGCAGTDIVADHVPPGRESDPSSGWEKRYFRAPPAWRRTHLHVREVGRPNWRYALLFRDYLCASPPAAEGYARVKRALARLHPDDVEAYYDVKDPVCDLVMDAAERWAGETGWVP